MSGPSAKHRRTLLALEAGVPNLALRRVLERLRDANVDLADIRLDQRAVERALEAQYGDHVTTLRIPSTDGPFNWEVAVPAAMLRTYLQSPALLPYFEAVLQSGAGCHPSHPIQLILYCDELTPGRALRINNKRKVMAIYVTLADFPRALRGHREVWIPMAFLRSDIQKHAIGAWTSTYRILLDNMLLGANSIADAGVVFKLRDETSRLVFFTVSGVIGDAPARAEFWGAMGSSGIMSCMNCLLVASPDSGLALEDPGIVDFSCTDRSKFGAARDADIWEKFEELAAQRPHCTKTAFGKLETAAGMRHLPNGVLASIPLQRFMGPVRANVVDPMHVLVSNGTINFEIGECFDSAGWSECYEDMRTLAAANWQLPKRLKNIDLKIPFDHHHQTASKKDSRTFRCQASELLAVTPLIRYYVDMKIARRADMSAQVASFRAAHDVLCATMSSKARGDVAPTDIDEKAVSHLDKFQAAYGIDHMKSKHHSEMHLGENAAKLDGAMDCFAQERKAAAVKIGNNHVDKTARFERTTLLNVVHGELRSLSDADWWANKLCGTIADYPELAAAQGAASCEGALRMQWQHVAYAVGDVVFFDGMPCMLECMLRFQSLGRRSFAFLVVPFTDEVRVTATASRWRARHDLQYHVAYLTPTSDVRQAALYDIEDEEHVLVIVR